MRKAKKINNSENLWQWTRPVSDEDHSAQKMSTRDIWGKF